MNDITWHYPTTIEEAEELVVRKGLVPHGGGLGILMGGLADRVAGFVDVSHLPLRHFQRHGGQYTLGAGLSFSGAARKLQAEDESHVLLKSLGQAMSTPLRNRATLGGSIAQFPIWSDLMGPLLALDASVELAGAQKGTYPVAEFVTDRDLRKGALITAVSFADRKWDSAYRRVSRTRFDYSSFNITVLAERKGGVVEDIRIVVVGCANKFNRLSDLETLLRENNLDAAGIAAAASAVELEFPPKKIGSPEYLQALAKVELERALVSVLS